MLGPFYDESDCCGNGCANCVLEIKSTPQTIKLSIDLSGKLNIIENYTEFSLKSKVSHSNLTDVFEMHFESCLQDQEKANYVLRIPSGHHIMMRAPNPSVQIDEKKHILRPYSPYSVDTSKLEFKILVNLKSKGLMSRLISDLHEGDKIEFRGPIGGSYDYRASSASKKLYIISQGVALAPTIPIIEEILENEDDMTVISHFACFLDLDHVYFRRRLHEFKSYWNYNLRIYLARQQCGNDECIRNGSCVDGCANLAGKLYYKEQVFLYRLTEAELGKHCHSIDTHEESIFIISGTRTFQDQMSDILKALDIGADDTNICLL